MSSLEQTIKDDWANRQVIESLSLGIRDMSEFLNKFGMSAVSTIMLDVDSQARFMMSRLDEKLTSLERKMAFIEARIVTIVPPQ